jgi:hypothetical protein
MPNRGLESFSKVLREGNCRNVGEIHEKNWAKPEK